MLKAGRVFLRAFDAESLRLRLGPGSPQECQIVSCSPEGLNSTLRGEKTTFLHQQHHRNTMRMWVFSMRERTHKLDLRVTPLLRCHQHVPIPFSNKEVCVNCSHQDSLERKTQTSKGSYLHNQPASSMIPIPCWIPPF